jgi:ankyrin repeat protein
VAAGNGDVELARILLGLGADPDIEDGRFHSTPLGWAHHFEQPDVVALLEPLTN